MIGVFSLGTFVILFYLHEFAIVSETVVKRTPVLRSCREDTQVFVADQMTRLIEISTELLQSASATFIGPA